MAVDFDTVTQSALSLPEKQRVSLAHRLLNSVEPEPDPDVEAAWEKEIQRRIAALDAGTAITYPAEEVLARLRQLTSQRK